MKVKVHKIAGGTSMRTETMTGTLYSEARKERDSLPEKGNRLIVTNTEPLNEFVDGMKTDHRELSTSYIVNFHDVDGGRQVTTKSGSIYFIEPI